MEWRSKNDSESENVLYYEIITTQNLKMTPNLKIFWNLKIADLKMSKNHN